MNKESARLLELFLESLPYEERYIYADWVLIGINKYRERSWISSDIQG